MIKTFFSFEKTQFYHGYTSILCDMNMCFLRGSSFNLLKFIFPGFKLSGQEFKTGKSLSIDFSVQWLTWALCRSTDSKNSCLANSSYACVSCFSIEISFHRVKGEIFCVLHITYIIN